MKKLTLTIVLCWLAMIAMATDLKVTLSDFTVTPATNRTVYVQNLTTPTATSSSTIIGSRITYISDNSGVFYISNIVQNSLYSFSVQAPPSRTDFTVEILGTDVGLINAHSNMVAFSTSTFPAGSVAWSAVSSDLRYARNSSLAFPAAGTNTFAATNGPVVTIDVVTNPVFATVISTNNLTVGTNGAVPAGMTGNIEGALRVNGAIYSSNAVVAQGQIVAAGAGAQFVGNGNGITNVGVASSTTRTVNVKDFGAFGDATNGTVTSVIGNQLIGSPATPFTLANVGNIISITKAGPSGRALTTTISGFVNATTVNLTASASQPVGNTNVFVYGAHDDTTAIQAALNDVTTNCGGKILFPPGMYIVAGAIQDPGPFWTVTNLNAQISCPAIGLGQLNAASLLGISPPFLTIIFEGAVEKNTTIWSTLSEGGGGSVFDFKNKVNPAATQNLGARGILGQNLVMPVFNKLTIRTMNDANITPLDFEGAVNAYVSDCSINAGLDLGTSLPVTTTRTNHAGIVWPCGGNYGLSGCDRVWVLGYWNGMTCGEHFQGGKALIGDCYFALTGGGFSSGGHVNRFSNLDVIGCHRFVDVMGTRGNYVAIDYTGNIEAPASTFWTYNGGTDIINDTSGLFSGALHLSVIGANPFPTMPTDTTAPNVSVEIAGETTVGTPATSVATYYRNTKNFAANINVTNNANVAQVLTAGTDGVTSFPLTLNGNGNTMLLNTLGGNLIICRKLGDGSWWRFGSSYFGVDKGFGTFGDFVLRTSEHEAANISTFAFHTNGNFQAYSNGLFGGSLSALNVTNTSLTASTIKLTDANKGEVSLANGGANTFLQGTTPPTYTAVALGAAVSGQLPLANGGTAANLSSPGANTLLGWDNTDAAVKFLTLGAGLTYTHSTHTLSASTGGAGSDTTAWHQGGDPSGVAFGPTNLNEIQWRVSENGGNNALVGDLITYVNADSVNFQVGSSNSFGSSGFGEMIFGTHNSVGNGVTWPTIAGGGFNSINANGNQAFIGGGATNSANGAYSVAFGNWATAANDRSFVFNGLGVVNLTTSGSGGDNGKILWGGTGFEFTNNAFGSWKMFGINPANSTNLMPVANAPDFNYPVQLFSTNNVVVFQACTNVDSTGKFYQTCTIFVTNTTPATPRAILPPANCLTNGTPGNGRPFVTNLTQCIFYQYGNKWTNMEWKPIF